ncbi:MAG: hypothetical protein ACYSU4_21815 [Planctomycetota bacterium]|jgi:hypothetical protein
MADFINFMEDALFDGGLRGTCLAQLKNPDNTTADISTWFTNKGYTVSEADIARLKQILLDHERVHGPEKLLPKY